MRGSARLVRSSVVVGLVAAVLSAGGATTSAHPRPHPTPFVEVTARAETPPAEGDNSDDPAIWVNRRDPSRSLVIGALKNEGLGVHDLSGRRIQLIPPQPAPPGAEAPSRFNNVDLVHGFRLGGRTVDLAVVSDRGLDRVRAYRIDPGSRTAPLVDVSAPDLPFVFNRDLAEVGEQATVYGLTAWTDPRTRRATVYVTRRHSLPVAQLELVERHGKVTYRRTGTLDLPGTFRLPNGTTWTPCEDRGEQAQSEAMVVDPAARLLYVAQEDVGIWRVPVPLGRQRPVLVQKVRSFGVPGTFDEETEECVPGEDPGFGGEQLTADVEGLEIVPRRGRPPVLLASSQGDNTFAVYERDGTRYRGGFAVVDDPGGVDGSSDCDGLAVSPLPLGPRWPGGLAVVQDGDDQPSAEEGEFSSFKLVPWEKISRGLRL